MSVTLAAPGWSQAEIIRPDDWISLEPYTKAQDLHPTDEVTPSSHWVTPVHRSVTLTLPSYPHHAVESSASFVRQITPTHIPSGSLLLRYEGFHRFVVKRAQSKFRSYWRKQMRMYVRDTFMSPIELGEIQSQLFDAWSDMHTVGNWWDRTMWESLPPEQGGAPLLPYVHTYGQEVAIFEWGPLTIRNTMKAKVSSVELLSLEDGSNFVYRSLRGGKVARDDARLERHVLDPLDDDSEPDDDEEIGDLPSWHPNMRVQFNFAPEVRRKLWDNVSWRFKARPSIRLSPSLDYMEVVRELSLKAEFDILYGATRQKVIGIEAQIEYEPEQNELEFTFEIAMLAW